MNGGFLVLTPSQKVFDDMAQLIEARGDTMPEDVPPESWDPEVGWGRPLDKFYKIGGKFREAKGWHFNAAWSDQGLLYHYFRFVDPLGVDIYEVQNPDKTVLLTYVAGTLIKEQITESLPTRFEHFAGSVKPWTLCPKPSPAALMGFVRSTVPKEKRTDSKVRAFPVWHRLYGELDVDLSLKELCRFG